MLEQARYLNHFYFIALVGFLMIWVPANRSASIDARLRPAIRSDWVPAWSLWILRAQIGLVYFYGGVAKINGDWLRARPLKDWLSSRTDFPVIGPLFSETWTAHAFSYAGLAIDIGGRALLAVAQDATVRVRGAGDVPLDERPVVHDRRVSLVRAGDDGPLLPSGLAAALVRWPREGGKRPEDGASTGLPLGALALGAFFVFQCLIPLRHWLYPGNVAWTEEGHNFSWRMKLRSKEAAVRYVLTDPQSSTIRRVDPRG